MFLEALKCKNVSRPPVWLMRQAGRYLPSYRALREKYSLKELFFTPELAAEITLMPIEELGVDAAIVFSDITVIVEALGFDLEFAEGPVIQGHLQPCRIEALEPVFEAIRQVKSNLKVPLIGFCGGPYTVASYIHRDLSLLEPLTEATIQYIQNQEKAGIDALQIFESWGGELSDEDFQKFCTPYLSRLVAAAHVPVIVFMRGGCRRIKELVNLRPDAISFDWEKPLHEIRPLVPMAVQGNLNPKLLYESFHVIRKETQNLLCSMKQDQGFIVNLGHGLRPDMPLEAVRCLVDTVKNF